jgi:hypothetical protein
LNRGAQFIRDEFGRRSQKEMGWDAAGGGFAHLYINGVYWGLYNMVERADEDFARLHFGGEKDDYDALKQGPELLGGNMDAWNQMTALSGLANAVQYQKMMQVLDIAAHVDYTLLEIWGGNLDWPTNNWRAVRKSRNRKADDIQFRIFIWDFERALLMKTVDISTTPGVAGLHQRLGANTEYRKLFAERARKHLVDAGGALTAGAAATRYNAIAREIEQSVPLESARWGDDHPRDAGNPATVEDWRRERDRLLRDWFPERTGIVLGQLRERGLAP